MLLLPQKPQILERYGNFISNLSPRNGFVFSCVGNNTRRPKKELFYYTPAENASEKFLVLLTTLEEACEKLDTYFSPQRNLIYEKWDLSKQQASEEGCLTYIPRLWIRWELWNLITAREAVSTVVLCSIKTIEKFKFEIYVIDYVRSSVSLNFKTQYLNFLILGFNFLGF